jgi:HPt (histidine-containing phosphotransfer) domain-containing protein
MKTKFKIQDFKKKFDNIVFLKSHCTANTVFLVVEIEFVVSVIRLYVDCFNMENTDCSVCVQKFNTKHPPIQCPQCDFVCCSSCYKKFLLSNNQDAMCMNCKTMYDIEFLYKNLSKAFLETDYKKHRSELLYQRELSMLQSTQPYVELELEIEKTEKEYQKLKEDVQKLKSKLQMLRYRKKIGQVLESTEQEKCIAKCPQSSCLGFLSNDWYCKLCQTSTCKNCMEILNDNHECNDEIVKSVKEVNDNSKPCPKCGIRIYKIDGCNQMFCVECHAFFSWKTLQLDFTGRYHNPHYLDYLKKRNILQRDPNDILCGRQLNHIFVNDLLEILKVKYGDKDFYDFVDPCRKIIVLRDIRLQDYRQAKQNLDLRIMLMMGKISKQVFRQRIVKREKTNFINSQVFNLIQMFISLITELFYNFSTDLDHVKLKKQTYELLCITNQYLLDVQKKYHLSSVLQLNEEFEIYKTRL